jgi:hypothetical protein
MNLLASSNTNLPEVPTFIQLLHDHPLLERWVHFLIYWEDLIFSAIIGILISTIVI